MMVLTEAVRWDVYDVLSWQQITKARFDFVIPTWRCLFDIGNLLNLKISHELDFADFWPGRSDASPENRRFRDDAHGLFDGCGGSPKRPERNPSFLP
jgi:hypothetical protein